MNENVVQKIEIKNLLRKKFNFLFDFNSLFYYVLLLIVVGFGFFAYALITQHFSIPFSGDFSQQAFQFYYNFYDDWWTFFNTGKFPFYDANTFIGADNVLANTYYGLFSPFTFPILLLPRVAVPQGIALISIAKLVVGGLLFRVYLKYIGCSERTARIFSLAYAFTGWMAYYLWFNCFYEVLTFLPLILYGIEKVIKEKKIWAVSLGYFLMGLGNYFFLLTFGIFGVIYAIFRYFQTIKTRNTRDNWLVIAYGIAGFALGYLMCAAVVFPAVLSSFGITRATQSQYLPKLKEAFSTGDFSKAFEIIFTYWNPNVANYGTPANQYYFAFTFPLVSYFYPTASCRYVNLVHFTDFENAGSSIFYFTPLMIMFFASFWQSIKNKKVSHFIALGLILLCLFVPFFYFLCGAFSNCYGRWEIVVPAIGIAYIAKNFDQRDKISSKTILISGIITFVAALLVFFLARSMISIYGNEDKTVARIEDFGDMWALIIYEWVLIVVETFLLGKFWKKSFLPAIVNCLIVGEIIAMGTIVANNHYLQDVETDVNGGISQLAIETNIVDRINKQDNTFFRIQNRSVDESHPNLPEAEGYNGISTFHTFYNNEVDDFVHMTQITNWDESWSAVSFGKHANLDEFLGVKYYITKDIDTTYNITTKNEQGEDIVTQYTFEPNVALNYSLNESLSGNGYRVYENQKQINFATSYDTLYYKHRVKENPKYNDFYRGGSTYSFLRNEEALFSGAILNDEDIEDVVNNNGDIFDLKTAPLLEAQELDINAKYYYIKDKDTWFDPFKPYEQTTDENRIYKLNDPDIDAKKMVIVYEQNESETFSIGSKGGYYMFDYPNRYTWGDDYSCAVFLVNKEGKVFSFDDWRNSANSNANGHMIKGIYAKEPIKSMIVVPLGNAFQRYIPSMYYEPWEDVESRFNNAILNGVTDLTYSVNDFTFNTNYSMSRFVVTQAAYTGGWKVTATDENGVTTNLKTYNAQGGFVGFVAPKGKVSYSMTYSTPGFKKWLAVSAGALLGVVLISVVPPIIKKKRIHKDSN